MRWWPRGTLQWRRDARKGVAPPPLPSLVALSVLTSAIPARSKCSGWNDLGQLGLGDTQRRGDDAMEDSMVAMHDQHCQKYDIISSAVNPSTLNPKSQP